MNSCDYKSFEETTCWDRMIKCLKLQNIDHLPSEETENQQKSELDPDLFSLEIENLNNSIVNGDLSGSYTSLSNILECLALYNIPLDADDCIYDSALLNDLFMICREEKYPQDMVEAALTIIYSIFKRYPSLIDDMLCNNYAEILLSRFDVKQSPQVIIQLFKIFSFMCGNMKYHEMFVDNDFFKLYANIASSANNFIKLGPSISYFLTHLIQIDINHRLQNLSAAYNLFSVATKIKISDWKHEEIFCSVCDILNNSLDAIQFTSIGDRVFFIHHFGFYALLKHTLRCVPLLIPKALKTIELLFNDVDDENDNIMVNVEHESIMINRKISEFCTNNDVLRILMKLITGNFPAVLELPSPLKESFPNEIFRKIQCTALSLMSECIQASHKFMEIFIEEEIPDILYNDLGTFDFDGKISILNLTHSILSCCHNDHERKRFMRPELIDECIELLETSQKDPALISLLYFYSIAKTYINHTTESEFYQEVIDHIQPYVEIKMDNELT